MKHRRADMPGTISSRPVTCKKQQSLHHARVWFKECLPMPNMKMRDVKVGEAIMYNNEVWVIFDRHEQTRGNLRTYWQIKLKHLERGNVVEQRFSPDDNVEKLILNRQEYEYLYLDGDMFVFMEPGTYEQIYVNSSHVPEAQHGFMVPNMKISLLKIEDKVVQVELPQTVEVEVTDAPDAAR